MKSMDKYKYDDKKFNQRVNLAGLNQPAVASHILVLLDQILKQSN